MWLPGLISVSAVLSTGASLGLAKPSHLDWLRNEVIHQGKVFNFMHFYEHFIHDLCFCTFNVLILKDISHFIHFILYEIKSGQKRIHLASFFVLVFFWRNSRLMKPLYFWVVEKLYSFSSIWTVKRALWICLCKLPSGPKFETLMARNQWISILTDRRVFTANSVSVKPRGS